MAATGFILLVSLAASAALSAVSNWIGGLLPGMELLLSVANFAVSLCIIAALFAAIYKVLPDRDMEWRDVIIGAFVTAILFVIGKSLIGWYLGSSAIGTSFGAASALAILLLWVYYSSQSSWSAPSSPGPGAASRAPRRPSRPLPSRPSRRQHLRQQQKKTEAGISSAARR